MRNWIAGAMTVLGTLLVLGGAVTIILRAWWKPVAEGATETAPTASPAPSSIGGDLFGTPTPAPPAPAAPARPVRPFGRLDAPERLIAWGIVLLVLAAVAAGAIGFDLGASAPVR
jgi:hypothetical protein